MRIHIVIATLLLAASCGSVSSINSDGGRGGSPGTGGSTGTGGNQGGSSGGSTGGLTCEQIQADYQAALATARECSVGGTNQCQKTVTNALGCNGCPTFVNDDSGLSQYQNAWNQGGCSQNQVCANIACLAPRAATCKASDAGGATCVDSFVATPAN
jgi:hypothetical protein